MIITKSRVAMSLFYIIFGGIFVLLGFWQIERGQEKQSIVDDYNIAQMQSSVAYSRDSKTWDYVYLKGYIDQSRLILICLLYTSPSPRDATLSRMPSSA